MHYPSIPLKEERQGLRICKTTIYGTRTKVLGYLRYNLLRHPRERNTRNAPLPYTNSYMNRWKNRIIAKPHLQLYYRNGRLIMTEIGSGSYFTDKWGSTETLSYLSSTAFLYQLHYSTLAGQQGERRMYNSMLREYYWSHIANEATQLWEIVISESKMCRLQKIGVPCKYSLLEIC